jgi:hypothetical protein
MLSKRRNRANFHDLGFRILQQQESPAIVQQWANSGVPTRINGALMMRSRTGLQMIRIAIFELMVSPVKYKSIICFRPHPTTSCVSLE